MAMASYEGWARCSPVLRPLACILALAALAGCTAVPFGAPSGAGRALALEPLDQCVSRQGTELHRVVTTQAEWEQLWRQACGDGSVLRVASAGPQDGAPPPVDFDSRSVIVSFWGEQRSGGYTVRILAAAAFADRVVVEVERTAPGPGCGTIAALTYPHAMAVVAKVTVPPQFRFTDQVREC